MIPVPPEELERLREALRATDATPGQGVDCPTTDAMWAAATGAAAQEAVEAVIDHTIECPACAEVWRLARAFALEGGVVPEKTDSSVPHQPTSRPWSTQFVALAAAAMLVLAAGVAYQLDWLGRDDEAVFRDAASSGLVDSLVGDEPLPRDRFVLRWTPGPAESRYNVTVTSEDLTPLDNATALTEPEFIVSESSLATLRAGAIVVWQVETVLPDGRRTQSRAFLTRIE